MADPHCTKQMSSGGPSEDREAVSSVLADETSNTTSIIGNTGDSMGGASSSPAASGSRSSPSPSAPVTTTPPPPPPPSTTDATKPPSPPTQTQPPTPPTGTQTAGQGSSEGKSYGTVLITHPACIEHCIKDHIERPARLTTIVNALRGAFPTLPTFAASRATREQLLLFHTPKHVNKVLSTFARSCERRKEERIDGDTSAMPKTEEAAMRAAGAVMQGVDLVMRGGAHNVFCAVRPPGHHAEPDKAMGFCFFNNVGIAALYARKAYGLRRIACIDWDVHHGNGTQAFFENDPDLFYASTHQGEGHYPGTGHAREKGVAGNIVNVPLPHDSGSDAFRMANESEVFPKLRAFKPQLLLISAGFDAHDLDPLSDMELSNEDYYWVTKGLVEIAAECGAPVVSALEGGYNLTALAESSVEHVRSLLEASAAAQGQAGPVQTEAEKAATAAPVLDEREAELARLTADLKLDDLLERIAKVTVADKAGAGGNGADEPGK